MTDLLASYRAAGPGHDEMLQSTGATRSAWDQLAALAGLESWDQLKLRQGDVTTLLEDHGVRQLDGASTTPWPLDPLPVMLDEQEWNVLERGLRQRALLLDAVLTDLVTERRLLTGGILPAEIVLAHPGFLRSAHGITIPGKHQLFTHATDILRNADGHWVALSDRTQAPSGMGYVMEDRRVIAQVLAGLYRQARIRRLGPFFHAMREGLREVAPATAGDNPRIVMLTSGPDSATAFDQSYLSQMLGFPLVEGEDLAVSDGRVWMRSLDALEPVDVIIRRVPADQCDPLDLRGDSTTGVPGLLEAARTGAITIVNPLNAGVLENPALLTYLPRLAREVFGEELLIPSAATYWCGERSMCSHVIANLDRLTITSTQPQEQPIQGWQLTTFDRADLAVRISQNPHQWVGQEPTEPSTTPTIGQGQLDARATVLRTFALARQSGYQVMSGALARVNPLPESLDAPAAQATVKDVWILSTEPTTHAEGVLADEPEVLAPRGQWATTISPGAAEDLYWFGRYTERTESTVRLIRAVADRWADYHQLPQTSGGKALAVLQRTVSEVIGPGSLTDLVLDADLQGSVSFAVARSIRAATAVREQLSADTWMALSSIERALARERVRQSRGVQASVGLGPVLARCLEGLLALAGLGAESMVRDVGWWLMDAGRRMERAEHLVRMLRATVTQKRSTVVDAMIQESVLISQESIITYRRRSQTHVRLDTLLELLLLDITNPRSLAYQLAQLRADLSNLPGGPSRRAGREQLLADLDDLLTELDPAAASGVDDQGHRPRLMESLDSLSWRLTELSREVAATYFEHPTATQWADASGTWTNASATGQQGGPEPPGNDE
ncbi:MAG: circularly permuted type 2 ATP-grasp protein [Beutenbergiaceae bacterium]